MKENRFHRSRVRVYLMLCFVLWSGAIIKEGKDHFLSRETLQKIQGEENTCLLEKESYDGRLSILQKDSICARILKKYEALEVEAVKTEELYTVYAYTKQYEEIILVGEKQINLNLVFYYNEIEDKTILLLASPIYNEDY